MLPRSKRFALAKCSRLAQTLGKCDERGCKPRPAWKLIIANSPIFRVCEPAQNSPRTQSSIGDCPLFLISPDKGIGCKITLHPNVAR